MSSGVTWNGTEKVNYTYDSLGRLTNKKVNSVLNNNYSYVDVNSTKTTTLLSSLSTVAGTYTYTYDSLGNITSITDGTYTTSYEYDDLNQLVRENDQKANRTYVYTYSNGNITSKKEYAYTTGDLGALQDTITWNYADSTWGDLLTSFDGTSITHDEIGNPITYGNYTINWNGRRLESINLNDTEVLSYEYNIDGQRVSKTYEGVTTEYFYNGSILAGEKTGNNVIIYMYDNNGDIFGFTYNGTEYYYIKNAQNDVVAIADASGNVVVRYYYNAWGEIIDCVDNTTVELSSINPITYRSYYNDNVAGMDVYYLNSRYYMADWGRFVSADSVQTLSVQNDLYDKNLFAYCDNNPIMRSDNGGYFWNVVIGTVVGGIVGGVVAGITSYIQTGKVDWGSVAINAAVGAVSGAIAATGLGALAQAGLTALTCGAGNFAEQCYTKGIKNVNYAEVVSSTVVGGSTSLLGTGAGKLAGNKLYKSGMELINKGKDKLLTGAVREAVGQSHSSLMRQGRKFISQGTVKINTFRGCSSVIGSGLGIGTSFSYSALKEKVFRW